MAAVSIGNGRFTSALADLYYKPRVYAARYPLIVFQTGGNDTPATTGMTGARATLDALVALGYCVVQLSAGAWGNTAAMSRMTDAITWGQANLPVLPGQVIVIGTSNGGVCSLQYARQHDVIACITFIAPIDLNFLRDGDVSSTRAGLDAAFSVTWSAPGIEALPAHADLWSDSAAYAGKPIQMWTSSDDPLNNPSQTQQAWAGLVGADWHNLGAVGHLYTSLATVDIPTVLAFIDARS